MASRATTVKKNSPARIRTTRAYGDVLKFITRADSSQIQEFLNAIGYEDRKILRKLSITERGQAVTSSDFILHMRHLRTAIGGATEEKERKQALETFHQLVPRGGKGNLFVQAVWDYLPTAYKGTRAVRSGSASVSAGRRGSLARTGSAGSTGSRYEAYSPSYSAGGGGRRTRRARKVTRKNVPVKGFAVVHSKEKPWVKEPNYRRWLAKLRRHTRRVAKEGEDENPQNMCVDSDLCKGDLGIPRRLMPQFTSPRDIRSFVSFIGKRYGIKAVRGTRRAGQLRPSQEEIHRGRVEGVKEEIEAKKLDPNVPLIVSSDGYVIDGHHRWAAYKSHEPSKKMPVLIVKDTARDVLSMAATWGAKHHQF